MTYKLCCVYKYIASLFMNIKSAIAAPLKHEQRCDASRNLIDLPRLSERGSFQNSPLPSRGNRRAAFACDEALREKYGEPRWFSVHCHDDFCGRGGKCGRGVAENDEVRCHLSHRELFFADDHTHRHMGRNR